MIGTMQFEKMIAFYGKVFDRPADMNDETFKGWMVGDCFIGINKHTEMTGQAKDFGRVMFNFQTKEIKEEFERMVKAGATIIKEPYSMDGSENPQIATLADPDGNYFQLMLPWEGS